MIFLWCLWRPYSKWSDNKFPPRSLMFSEEGLGFSWIKIVWRNGLQTVLVGLKKPIGYQLPRCGMKRDTISCITFFWQLRKPGRGELWVATSCCNGYLQNLLLRLIEWHAKGKGQRDIWHKGRFLEHWSEQEIVHALPDTFAKYSLEDVQRALKANLHFYDTFGREIANAFGYDFPEEAYSFAVEQLQELVGKADDHQEPPRLDGGGR